MEEYLTRAPATWDFPDAPETQAPEEAPTDGGRPEESTLDPPNAVEMLELADFPDKAITLLEQELHSRGELAQRGLLKRIEARAKELGYKGFRNDWAAHKRDQKKLMQHTTSTQGNYVEGLPERYSDLILCCGDWKSDKDGVRLPQGMADVWACRHPIFPVARTRDIMTDEAGLVVAFRNHGPWQEVTAPRGTFAESRALIGALAARGAAVSSDAAAKLGRYIADVEALSDLPERLTASRCGWHKGDFLPFVDGVALVAENNRQLAGALDQKGSILASVSTLTEARRSLPVKIAIAASFASVLVGPLHCLPFVVHLWSGTSGTGKTVALLAAASVWGNPDTLVGNFDVTAVALEQRAGFLNNLPLFVDELQLARGSAAEMLYQVTEGHGRGRGRRTGGTKTTLDWANTTLTTGETPLTGAADGAGAVNRCISVGCGSDPLFPNGHKTAEALRADYGFAGPLFLQEYRDHNAEAPAKSLFGGFLEALKEYDTTDKQRLSAALLLTADTMACEFVFQGSDPLTVSEIAQYLTPAKEVDIGLRAYEFLTGWIAGNGERFTTSAYSSAERYGIIEGNTAWIISRAFNDVLTGAGFNPDAVKRALSARGLLIPGKERLACLKRLKVHDGTSVPTRCIQLVIS